MTFLPFDWRTPQSRIRSLCVGFELGSNNLVVFESTTLYTLLHSLDDDQHQALLAEIDEAIQGLNTADFELGAHITGAIDMLAVLHSRNCLALRQAGQKGPCIGRKIVDTVRALDKRIRELTQQTLRM